jgi:predicted acetyltransferase
MMPALYRYPRPASCPQPGRIRYGDGLWRRRRHRGRVLRAAMQSHSAAGHDTNGGMAADYQVRPAAAEEFTAFYAVREHAFNWAAPSEPYRTYELALFEPERSLAAFDQDSIVATACAYSFQMTVPGAVARVAGVSGVAVLPTHRRRGLLSELMRRQLADIRGRGEAVAALFASEPGIYGRYGYGAASSHLQFVIPRAAQLSPLGAAARAGQDFAGLRLRITEAPHPLADLARVHDAVLPGRPGMYAMDSRWWESTLADPEDDRDGATRLRCLIASDAAGARGYAMYSVQPSWNEGVAAAALDVRELLAADPEAYAAIWTDLLTRDLVAEVRAQMRPLDDPLPYFLADRRRARATLTDGLWVRLVDVPGALSQRRYAGQVDVVIEVADELLPANAGRWRLLADRAGGPARCERASAPADIALPVQALGSAYLGGTRLGELARAGLVTELRPGTLALLSTALSWDPVPWCPRIF